MSQAQKDNSAQDRTHKGQFALLFERRFGPLFVTQFCGAFNDNVVKNALAIFITFHAADLGTMSPALLVNLSAGLFILPFFLFSALAGQLAEANEKTTIVRLVRWIEIPTLILAAIGFSIHNIWLLLAAVFLLGTQSAFFGPVKYSILPQHVSSRELVGANGMIEFGTFVSILLGTIAGGLVAANPERIVLSLGMVGGFMAFIGLLSAYAIPKAPATAPHLPASWNLFRETFNCLKIVRHKKSVFLSVLAISWFWLFGGTYLTQFPGYVRDHLHGNESVVTLLLALFSVGVGSGSLLCERLSGHRVELGLVPLGAIGLTIFSLDLFFATPTLPPATLQTVADIAGSIGGIRLCFDLLFIGLFGGMFIVPLYAFVQSRTDNSMQSRIIAGNNIMNAGFMVFGAAVAALLLGAGYTVPQVWLITTAAHALVSIYIFTVVPEFLMRFLIWMLMHSIYRLKVSGIEKLPAEGPALLAANHVSFVDALVIAAASPRPIRFVMYYKIFHLPILSFIFRTAKAIPIAGAKEDSAMMTRAFAQVNEALQNDELVCIFPEGKITDTGKLNQFKSGIERIVTEAQAETYPVALEGLWGSIFSRKSRTVLSKLSLARLFSTVTVSVGQPLPASGFSAAHLERKVAEMLEYSAPASEQEKPS